MLIKLMIRDLRLAHPDKPSQRKMGDVLGMTESNYRKLESNKLDSVKLAHLNRLKEFYNCQSVNEIIDFCSDDY